MKSTYTLAWEEFKELHGDSWPHPDYFSTIVIALISVPLIGYGIALLTLGGLADEKFISYMFIGAPLFLLVAAAGSLKSQSKKALDRALAEKREDYDRWHAKEQSFSFDEAGWIHETQAGRQEVPWLALLQVVEWPNVLYLIAEGGSVIVPKRALEPAALDALRQLAFPVGPERWAFRISAWDYQATETARLWRRYWFRLAFANVFGLVILGWVLFSWLTSEEKIGVIWGWILASAAVVLTLTAQIWYVPLRYSTSRMHWRAPKRMAVSDHGVYLADSYSDLFAAWRSFHHFVEFGRCFLIYTDPAHYYLLSKRYFSPDQQAELRRRLQENVKQER